MRMGRHMPTAANPAQALTLAHEIGCDAIQIFVTNPRAWQPPDPRPEAEDAFRAQATALGWPVVAHAAYLINLASPRDDIFARSITLLRATLDRAERFGAREVIFHIGSHTGAGEEAGLSQLTAGIARTLDGAPQSVRLLLENDTGGGGKLGYRMENLARTLDALPQFADQLGVCIDTAHLWGAGFDIGAEAGVVATLAEIERTVGLARVPALHINDAKAALGSHRDIHARLGEGQIPLEGLRAFLRSPALAHTTALLETPYVEDAAGRPDWTREAELMGAARALAGLPALVTTSPARPDQ